MYISIQRPFSIVFRIVSGLLRSINRLQLRNSPSTMSRATTHVVLHAGCSIVKPITITIVIIILIMSDMIRILYTYAFFHPSTIYDEFIFLISDYRSQPEAHQEMKSLSKWTPTNKKLVVEVSQHTSFSYSSPTGVFESPYVKHSQNEMDWLPVKCHIRLRMDWLPVKSGSSSHRLIWWILEPSISR